MEHILVKTAGDLERWLPHINRAKVIAADTETTGPDPHADRIRLIRMAAEGMPAILAIDCLSFLPDGAGLLKALMERGCVKAFQNAKFDLQFFMALGIYPAPVFDAMLAGQLLGTSGGPPRANLAALANHYLGEDIEKSGQKGSRDGEPGESQQVYAARGAEILLRLREVMIEEINKNRLRDVALIEFACVRAVAQMEYAGIGFDARRWRELARVTEKKRDEAQSVLYNYAGRPPVQMSLTGDDVVLNTNFDSNQYIVKLLRNNGIETDATSKRVLSAHADHPLINALSAYRKAAKALSGFLYPIPEMVNPITGRLHPKYGQIGAWSGRMSCGGPNIQQIPRDAAFRACFVAAPGKKLVIADYSQIELRVAAQISGDARMIDAYKRGEDLHALTAAIISNAPAGSVTASQRQAAKAVNFGLIFGMGAEGLRQYARQSYGVDMTAEQATVFRDNFFKAYPGIADWHRRVKRERAAEGRSLAGRKFMFGDNSGFSVLYNTPVQGAAADIAKAALGRLARQTCGTGASIVAAVHDEILVEADEAESEKAANMLRSAMERAGNEILTDVPCVADVKIADSWAGKR